MSATEGPIQIVRHDEHHVRLEPPWLPDARFDAYRRATEAARFDRRLRVKVAPLAKVPGLLIRLRDAGFEVDRMALPLVRALQRWTLAQALDLKSAEERIRRIDLEVQKQSENEYRMADYQKTGALWLTLRDAGLLCDSMGLGKTLQVIAAIPANAPVLVVAPAIAKGAWRGEMRKWRPNLPVAVLEGRASYRWPKVGEMVVTNYDVLPPVEGKVVRDPCRGCAEKLVSTANGVERVPGGHLRTCRGFTESRREPSRDPILQRVLPGTVLVADEAHFLKNPDAIRTVRFRELARAVLRTGGRVWPVTGTPIENEHGDLWAILEAADLARKAFGSRRDFDAFFAGRPSEADVKEALQEVMLRRLQEDVLSELPPMRLQPYVVELDARTLRGLDELLARSGRTVAEVAELLEKEEGFAPGELSQVRQAIAAAKIPAMLALVKDFEDRKEPVVVFSAHRAPIDALEGRPGWGLITGDVSNKRRQEVQDLFMAGKLQGIGMTIRAGGLAITLTRAARGIAVDEDWTPSKNLQAYKRLHRMGQRSKVIIIRLISNHALDERVSEVNRRKMRMIAASVDAAASQDDADLGQELRDQIARIQEEVASGRAVRAVASTPEQEETLEKLRSVVFGSARDERIGLQLLEEAHVIGLSEAQWALGAAVAARGEVPKARTEEAVEDEEDEGDVAVEDDAAPSPAAPRVRTGWGFGRRSRG